MGGPLIIILGHLRTAIYPYARTYIHNVTTHFEQFVDCDDKEANTEGSERFWKHVTKWMKRPGIRDRLFPSIFAVTCSPDWVREGGAPQLSRTGSFSVSSPDTPFNPKCCCRGYCSPHPPTLRMSHHTQTLQYKVTNYKRNYVHVYIASE